jgi:hypothetical protein
VAAPAADAIRFRPENQPGSSASHIFRGFHWKPFLYGDEELSSGGAGAWPLTVALSRETAYSLDFANHPFILELKGDNHGTSYFIITGNSLHQTARGIGAEREVQKQYLRGDQEGGVPGTGEIVDPLVRMDTQRDRGMGGVTREGEPFRKKMSL